MRGITPMMLVTTLLSGACGLATDDEAEDAQWRSGSLEDPNGTIIDPGDGAAGGGDGGGGRTGGDWVMNGLAEPEVSGVDPAFALDSPEGLGAEGWLAEGDPAGERVIRYLVECALDDDQAVIVEAAAGTLVLEGRLGLAPQWRTGPCDASCQEWVSACLLARTNETEIETMLFVQGDHPSLGFGDDPEFTLWEGTFFGNVFVDPPAMHACRGQAAATTEAEQQGRTCTKTESECGFTIHSSCVSDAGCQPGPTGVPTIDCQPDPQGPVYPGMSVHLAAL
jgi:hypothetical protein